MEDIIVWG